MASDPPADYGPYCPCILALVGEQLFAGAGSTFWLLDVNDGVASQARQHASNAFVMEGFLGAQRAPSLIGDHAVLTPGSDGFDSTDLRFDPGLPVIDIDGDYAIVESGGSLVAFGPKGVISQAQPEDNLPLDGESVQINSAGNTIGVGVPSGVLISKLEKRYLDSKFKRTADAETQRSKEAADDAACGGSGTPFEAYPGGVKGFLSGSQLRLIGGNVGRLFDCKTNRAYRTVLTPEDGWSNDAHTRSVELAQTVLQSDSQSQIAVVNGPFRYLVDLPVAAQQATYAPDGHRLVWIDSTGTRALWTVNVDEATGDLTGFRRIGQRRYPNLQEIAIDPSGRFVLISQLDGLPTLIDIATGSTVGSSLGPFNATVLAEDGRTELFARSLPQGLEGIRSDDSTTTWSWKLVSSRGQRCISNPEATQIFRDAMSPLRSRSPMPARSSHQPRYGGLCAIAWFPIAADERHARATGSHPGQCLIDINRPINSRQS